MSHPYLDTLITPAVEAAQRRYGSRDAMARALATWDADDRLGDEERAFIAERDSFAFATVTEHGWPYLQHRGGPAGFLHVLDPVTLGWADFRGNRQYLSVGNLGAAPRVSLLLIDHAHRRRLKILGTAEVVDARDDPALARRLTVPGYDARVERAVVVRVHGYDWNCPQHITPRFTADELRPALAPIEEELERLRDDNARLRAALAERADRAEA